MKNNPTPSQESKIDTSFISLSLLLHACTDSGIPSDEPDILPADTPFEAHLRDYGLVNITELDSSIAVYLVYATPYNFMGRKLYHGLTKAFTSPELGVKLCHALELLKSIRPDLTFLVYDAVRPVGIQHEMWDAVKDTPMHIYVANPNTGDGLHTYAAAIDLTLMDCTGIPLPMGCPYDYFGEESQVSPEPRLLKENRISRQEADNRLLLRKVMTEAGFLVLDTEWWHFNLMSIQEARQKMKLIQ